MFPNQTAVVEIPGALVGVVGPASQDKEYLASLTSNNLIQGEDRWDKEFNKGKAVVQIHSDLKAVIAHVDEDPDALAFRLECEGMRKGNINQIIHEHKQEQRLADTRDRLLKKLAAKKGKVVNTGKVKFLHRDANWQLYFAENGALQLSVFGKFKSASLQNFFYQRAEELFADDRLGPEQICETLKMIIGVNKLF